MSDKGSQTYLAQISSICKETQTQTAAQTGETQTQTHRELIDSETQTTRVYPVGIEINSVVQFIWSSWHALHTCLEYWEIGNEMTMSSQILWLTVLRIFEKLELFFVRGRFWGNANFKQSFSVIDFNAIFGYRLWESNCCKLLNSVLPVTSRLQNCEIYVYLLSVLTLVDDEQFMNYDSTMCLFSFHAIITSWYIKTPTWCIWILHDKLYD